ncbi:MAG: prepilin-type N-terminal cleavage/methylation domain-containing protein [Campylobacterota bacterium]|nr:prepilin-type N-terminal cleavage/methylation domain-containing protein [Campylobacterota bacterium]
MRKAFTLIEVMVAVVIISVVIMALIELLANSSHNFTSLGKKSQMNQYLSFFHSPSRHGFRDKESTLYDLVEDFDIESELKQELKSIKVEVVYQELKSIDMGDYDPEEEVQEEDVSLEDEEQVNSRMVFEIGKTVLKIESSSVALLRMREK